MTDTAATSDASQVRGRCRTCGKDYTLRDDGTVLLHRDDTGQACPGSREPPASVIQWPTPQVRVCAEPGCGRTSPPDKFPAHGLCWRSYGRWRRGQLGVAPTPPNPLLAELKAARARVTAYDQPEHDALGRFQTTVRLAYSDATPTEPGLSTYQIADLTGWAPSTIHEYLLPTQRRPSGTVGFGRPTAGPEKVAAWTPVLQHAAAAVLAIRDRRADAQQEFLDLLTAANRPDRPDRVGKRALGDALDVSHAMIQQWLRGARQLRQCIGFRTGPRGNGGRCQGYARRGYRTCWRHADQEPGGGR